MEEKYLELRIWQNKLYNLQREAPTPHCISCTNPLINRPRQYGEEYHGPITRTETELLLENSPNGSYLIRDSQRAANTYTLVILFDRVAKNFKLYYDQESGQHYVGETKFDTIDLLVADGLIHFYIETRGADVLKRIADANTYEKTPFYKTRYHTINAQSLELYMNFKSGDKKVVTNDHSSALPPNQLQYSAEPRLYQVSDSEKHKNGMQFNNCMDSGLSSCNHPMSRDSPELKKFEQYPPILYKRKQSSDKHSIAPMINDVLTESGVSHVKSPLPSDSQHNVQTVNECITQSLSTANASNPATCVHQSSSPSLSSDLFNIQKLPLPQFSHSSFRNNLPSTNNHYANQSVFDAFYNINRCSSNFGFTSAPLATCLSGDSSGIDSTHTNSSCDSHLSDCGISSDLVDRKLEKKLTNHLESNKIKLDMFGSNSAAASATTNNNNDSSNVTSNKKLFNDQLLISRRSDYKGNNALTDTADSMNVAHSSDGISALVKDDVMCKLKERYNLPTACVPDLSSVNIADIKSHSFKTHTYIGPHWCDYCTHFIWGLVAQGVKCADCGFQAHKRCADRVPYDCIPDMKQMKRVFGVDLTNLVRAENRTIPMIMVRCVQEIEQRGGLSCEGLYRVPGNHDLVEELRVEFDKSAETVNISESRIDDINVLASLIKSFLRQLPVPLITYEIYPEVIDIIRHDRLTEEEKLSRLRRVMDTLPISHYEGLRYFIKHINRVAEHQAVNMMTTNNLAIVLAPTLMSSSYTDPISCLAGTRFEHSLVSLLIANYDYLLPPRSVNPITITSNPQPQRTPVPDVNPTFQPPSRRLSHIVCSMSNDSISTSPPQSAPVTGLNAFPKKWSFLRTKSSTETKASTPPTGLIQYNQS